jgi:type II secretory pathway pseudopilin PulG
METDPGIRKSSRLELAVVIMVVSVLLVLFIPSIINLFSKSNEDTAISNLGSLRSALSAYYTDNQGYPTDDLTSLLNNSRYISTIPLIMTNQIHAPNYSVIVETAPTDTGKWSYNNDPNSASWGSIHIGCTHTNYKGVIWSTY